MKKTVLGLMVRGVDLAQPIRKLEESGLSGDQVAVIQEEKAVRKLLGCEPAVYETDAQIHIQGIRLGDHVLAVQADEEKLKASSWS